MSDIIYKNLDIIINEKKKLYEGIWRAQLARSICKERSTQRWLLKENSNAISSPFNFKLHSWCDDKQEDCNVSSNYCLGLSDIKVLRLHLLNRLMDWESIKFLQKQEHSFR